MELTKRQLRKTDNIARNDARLQSSLKLMFQDAKPGLRSTLSDEALTSADAGVPSDVKGCLPQTSHCHVPQEPVEKCVTGVIGDSSCVVSSVAVTSASVTTLMSITTLSSVAVTSVAKVITSVTRITSSVALTTASFTVMSTAATSLAVTEAVATGCLSFPLNSNSVSTTVAGNDGTKLTYSRITATQPSLLSSATVVTPPTTAKKSTSSVTTSANDDVKVKSCDSVAGQSSDSADATVITTGGSVDSLVVLADAAAAKSVDYVAATAARSFEPVTVTAGKSADSTAKSSDEMVMMVPPALFRALPISSPAPLSNTKSLSTSISPSPSPKGHVTFSDHVTEIQPSVGSSGGVNSKPRRMPPAPPPRKAIKNVPSNACPGMRDRPSSTVEPLAAVSGFPTVNGMGRARPLSMAPLATVDSDSDSSVGVESQTGTIRRNTTDKRNAGVELRNGGRGRTPPPVPTRKTSSLTLTAKNAADGFLMQDAEYSNLDDVRQECARLELGSGQQDGRLNGTKMDAVAKCEETEIY